RQAAAEAVAGAPRSAVAAARDAVARPSGPSPEPSLELPPEPPPQATLAPAVPLDRLVAPLETIEAGEVTSAVPETEAAPVFERFAAQMKPVWEAGEATPAEAAPELQPAAVAAADRVEVSTVEANQKALSA